MSIAKNKGKSDRSDCNKILELQKTHITYKAKRYYTVILISGYINGKKPIIPKGI